VLKEKEDEKFHPPWGGGKNDYPILIKININ
jgi:hypothetical protein